MKSRWALIVALLMLLTLGLVACADSVTPTAPANSTAAPATATIANTSQTVANNTQLPTFTPASTQPLATVTPAPTTTVAAPTATTATTAADTTTIATTAADTTTATTVADTSTTVAPATTDTTTIPTTTSPTTVATPALTTAPIATTKPATKISPVFLPVLAALRRQKEVAVVLPTYIPGTSDGNVYAIFQRGEDPGYYIVLGYTSDCQGGTACRVGTVIGRPAIANEVLPGKTVKLDKGIVGYFVNATCAANCPDATLTWKQGQGVYTVGIKAGKLSELTKMANSAIIAGQI